MTKSFSFLGTLVTKGKKGMSHGVVGKKWTIYIYMHSVYAIQALFRKQTPPTH